MKIIYNTGQSGPELIDPDSKTHYLPYEAHLCDLPDELVIAYWQARDVFSTLERMVLRAAIGAVESGHAETKIFGSAENQDAASASAEGSPETWKC